MTRKEIIGWMYPCELKHWTYDGDIMLPSKIALLENGCECKTKNHKPKKYKVTIEVYIIG